MLKKVVFTNFNQEDLPPALWSRVAGVAEEVKRVRRDDPAFLTEISDAEGLILRLGMSADSELMDRAPHLKYIGMLGTGYGRIDTDAARNRGIVVTNVADYSTESVAELVVAMTLNLLRNLYTEQLRANEGNVDETTFVGRDLSSMMVGVIGAGNIGTRVIKLMAQGFGSSVTYWNRSRRTSLEVHPNIEYVALDELVKNCDIVSIHLASNPETNGILDSRRIGSLKNGAILVSTAPNELVNLDAILERCAAGTLFFAMDHPDELESGDYEKLRDTPNTAVYPPIGYATKEAADRKVEVLISNIEAFVHGAPRNHVNP